MNAAWSFNGFYFSWVKDGVGLLGDGGIRSGNHIKTIASYIAVVALEASANLRIVKYSEHSQLKVSWNRVSSESPFPISTNKAQTYFVWLNRYQSSSHPSFHRFLSITFINAKSLHSEKSPLASRTKAMWHQRICVHGLNTRYSETKTCKFSVRRWRVRK